MTDPSKLDNDLSHLVSSYHRLRWVSLTVLACVVVIGISALSVLVYSQHLQLVAIRSQVESQHFQDEAACSFFRDLSKVPLTPMPPLKRPSKLGVSIVTDSHNAATGLGCPGVSPLSADALHWARYYGIAP